MLGLVVDITDVVRVEDIDVVGVEDAVGIDDTDAVGIDDTDGVGVKDTAAEPVVVTVADAVYDAVLVADRDEVPVELLVGVSIAVRVEVEDGVSTTRPATGTVDDAVVDGVTDGHAGALTLQLCDTAIVANVGQYVSLTIAPVFEAMHARARTWLPLHVAEQAENSETTAA
jgi:hypothetical protein